LAAVSLDILRLDASISEIAETEAAVYFSAESAEQISYPLQTGQKLLRRGYIPSKLFRTRKI
jgi:hypothetical protein